MENKKGYVDSYVAFIDILGFKNFITNENFEKVHKLFEDIKGVSDILLHNYDGHLTKEILDTVTVNIISDSIIISVPKSTDYSLEVVVLMVNCIVFILLINHNLLCRGSIAEGDFYSEGNVTFGSAFVDAYKQENSLAVYPRIVFTRKILDLYEATFDRTRLKIDLIYDMITYNCDDALYIVDYIGFNLFFSSYIVSKEKRDSGSTHFKQTHELYYRTIKRNIEFHLNHITDLHIREKYLYFRKYYNDIVLKAKKQNALPFKCDCIFVEDYPNDEKLYK